MRAYVYVQGWWDFPVRYSDYDYFEERSRIEREDWSENEETYENLVGVQFSKRGATERGGCGKVKFSGHIGKDP